MSKHIIGYGVLLVTTTVLAALLVNKPELESVNTFVKPTIKAPEVKDDKSEQLAELKRQLAAKDEYVKKLRETIDRKEVAKAAVESTTQEKKKLAKKNDILNILESSKNLFGNEKHRKIQKKFKAKRYAALFKKLNLNEKEQEQLLNLLMKRDQQKQEVFAKMFSNGGKNINITPETLKEASTTDADSEINDLLGDDYETFSKYEKSSRERSEIKDINASLSKEDNLTDEQEDQLTDLMMKRNQGKRQGEAAGDEEYLTEASEFLNEDQVGEVSKSFKRNKNKSGFSSFTEGFSGGTHIEVFNVE